MNIKYKKFMESVLQNGTTVQNGIYETIYNEMTHNGISNDLAIVMIENGLLEGEILYEIFLRDRWTVTNKNVVDSHNYSTTPTSRLITNVDINKYRDTVGKFARSVAGMDVQ